MFTELLASGSGGGSGFKEALFFAMGGASPYTWVYLDSNGHSNITYNSFLSLDITDNEYMDVKTSNNTMTITAKKAGKYIRKSTDRWSGYSEAEYNVNAGDVIFTRSSSASYNPSYSIYAV